MVRSGSENRWLVFPVLKIQNERGWLMKFSKFIVIPIMVAILACVMQIIDQFLAANTIVGALLKGGGSWIAFQAWAV